MSQEKAQLIAPLGNMTVPGVTATGVITATSFEGNIAGSATSIKQGSSITAGVVTASSFAGNLTGNIQRLADSGPNISVGVVTATSFSGNLTGSVTDLTGTPTISVGIVTATRLQGALTGDVTGDVTGNVSGVATGSVTGNVTGLASSVRSGVNLNVGVATAIQWEGNGATLTGAGSSAYIAQNITATGAETIIDLSYGNLIYYKGDADTTVGFASTSAAEQITFIRDTDSAYSISYSTGGVDFDGSGDYLSIPDSSDFNIDGTNFTLECWFKADDLSGNQAIAGQWELAGGTDRNFDFYLVGSTLYFENCRGSTNYSVTTTVSVDQWYHLAGVLDGTTLKLFVNGTLVGTTTVSGSANNSTANFGIGGYATGTVEEFNGQISNLRFVKGTAVYTTNFVPPSAALTNISGTKLLCCQSDSSTTTAAVTPGTITANGDPTAGSHTVSLNGSLNATITWPDRVKWNGGSAPTLFSNARDAAFQIFHFTTGDSGTTYQAWEEMKNNAETFALYSWGSGDDGILAQNSQTKYSSPTQVPGTTWSTLAGGFAFDSRGGIKNDGTLWGWGRNQHGQLAQNNKTNYSSPIQIPGTTWANVSIGGDNYISTVAIKTDGTMWSWGGNGDGNLGINNRTYYSSPVQVPGTTWKDVSNGADWVLATKTDGTAWAWGKNSHGYLGLNNKTEKSSPTQIGSNDNWSYMAAGRPFNSMGVKTDGTLWSWGLGNNGALGHNNTTGYSSPKQIPGSWSNTHPTKLSAGFYRGMAIKTDGTLWAWGYQASGELGQNNNTNYSSPRQIPGTTWESVDNMYNVTLATKTDGTLWSWGYNNTGELGLNDQAHRSSPVQIPGSWKLGEDGVGRTIAAMKSNGLALKGV